MSDATDTLHALAFIYLGFSHATDGELSADEMKTLAAKVRAWKTEASLEEVGQVLRAAVTEYRGISDPAERNEHMEKLASELKGRLDDAQKKQIVADLEAISKADGEVSAGEVRFIDRIAHAFGTSVQGRSDAEADDGPNFEGHIDVDAGDGGDGGDFDGG